MLPGGLHELLPVALTHRWVVQVRHEWERGEHGLDGFVKHLEDVEVAHALAQLLHLLLQFLGLVHEEVHVDLVPQGLVPVVEKVDHAGDHIPNLLQEEHLLAAAGDVHVVGHEQLEQLLAFIQVAGLFDQRRDRAEGVLVRLLPGVEMVQDDVGRLEALRVELALDSEGRLLLEEGPEVLHLLVETV